MILFRCDGNSHIATGHLMRCLSIARALKKKCIFLLSDMESKSVLCSFFSKSNEYPVQILHTANYRDLSVELSELKEVLAFYSEQEKELPTLFVDSYFVTNHYFLSLKNTAKLVYLDDLRVENYDVDLVINYDVIPEDDLSLYQASYSHSANMLLGSLYAPLRPQFAYAGLHRKNNANGILISSGGTDPEHCLLRLIPYIRNHFPIHPIHVLMGSMNPDKEKIYNLAKSDSHLIVHEALPDTAPLMLSVSLAITAAGTTLYELCACGTPSISYSFADNQIPSATAFHKVGAVPYIGDLRNDILPKELSSTLQEILSDSHLQNDLSSRMHSFVDGLGASRIAKEIENLSCFTEEMPR